MALPKVVLNMIVKNEGEIIAETLRHVRPFIDAYAIMDTGSTDNTIAEIEKALDGVPGRVGSMEWSGFAKSRNAAIDLADGLGDYLLFLDADDKFVMTADVEYIKRQLTQSIHPCNIMHGSILYDRMVFRSTKSQSRYHCAVHEVLIRTFDDSIGECLEGVHIVHNAIGLSNRNKQNVHKCIEDARIIEREIEKAEDPQLLPRYQFYLAQSYRDYGDLEKALAAYKTRVEMTNSWDQERYIAALECGKLYARGLGSVADQMFAYLQAIEIDPHRAEAHFYLAVLARSQKMWKLALHHAQIAQSLRPPARSLFAEPAVYEWKAAFEVSVSAFYAGVHEEGLRACNELLLHPDVPPHFKKQTLENKKFYETPVASR